MKWFAEYMEVNVPLLLAVNILVVYVCSGAAAPDITTPRV